MDTTTFANSVRTKYPDGVASDGRAYKDIPDAELADKIVQKYPVYKEQITDYKPYQADPSLMDTIKTRANAVMDNPVEAAKGFVKGGIKTAVGLTNAIDTGVTADINALGGNVGQGDQGVFGGKTMLDYAPVEEATQYSNEAQKGGANFETGVELVGGAVKTLAKGGAKLLAEKGAPLVKGAIDATGEYLAKRGALKAEKATIEAVNPDLTGKKLEAAYQQVVKGKQTVKPSGIFTEQSLSPSERAINLGKRLTSEETLSDGTKLAPIKLGDNSVKNLPKLKTALTDTENKLQTALKGNPDINYNADKAQLFDSLEAGIKNAPEEFRIQGPGLDTTKNVFAFAKKIAAGADDSIEGLRDARTAFDTQARLQYPTAFKDGAIDTKTAAGNAIKKARDIFNEHLYNTAPNGSDIQKLIGREADIFQATEPIAAKASKGEGLTKVQKAVTLVKDHPVASTVSTAAATYGATKALGQ